MRKQNGALTEWLGSGLQNRPQQFESAGHLQGKEIMLYALSLFIFTLNRRCSAEIMTVSHDLLHVFLSPLR